jgi:hypothetical protein
MIKPSAGNASPSPLPSYGSPLHLAVSFASQAVIDYLLEAMPKVNLIANFSCLNFITY